MAGTTVTQAELSERAHALWSAIRAAAYALSDEQIDRPNTIGSWSGRDVMVHIANWEEAATQAIRDLDAGKRYFEHAHETLLDTIRSSPNVYPRIVVSSYLYHL